MLNSLFKYFSTDCDKLERFTQRQIYLTPPRYFNDPWDFLPRSEPYTADKINEAIRFPSGAEGATQLRDFADYMNSPVSLENEAAQQQKGLSALVGVVCLAENPLDRLMWAHYADSHRGFVAEFRCAEIRFNSEGNAEAFSTCWSPFGGAMKVRYLPKPPLMLRDGSNLREVFWTKHELWKHEQEWRVVESLARARPHPGRDGFLVLEFRPSDLLKVIIGLRTCPAIKNRIEEMLTTREFGHVRTEEVYIDPASRDLKTRQLIG